MVDMTKVRECKECGVLFVPKEPWYHTCQNCYVNEERENQKDAMAGYLSEDWGDRE